MPENINVNVDVSAGEETPPAQPRPRHGWLALFGLLLAFAGPFLQILVFMNVPLLSRTGAAMLVVMFFGALLAISAAWRDRRFGTMLCGFVSTALAVFMAIAYPLMTRLPPPLQEPPLPGSKAPDFTLVNQLEQPTRLADGLSQGPTLLVFYRGHW